MAQEETNASNGSGRNLTVERWPFARLHVDPRNPRRHPPAQIRSLVRSIQEFGWTNPILADPAGVAIAGAGRLDAARACGEETVPVIVLDGFTPAQMQAYRIADNRIPMDAEWVEDLLAEVLGEIATAGLDLSVTGFTDDELTATLALLDGPGNGAASPQETEPAVPPLPVTPVTCLGDIWELGRHRLICGDCTDADVLGLLLHAGGLDGRPADMVFTDPPYGRNYGGGRAAGSTPKGARVKAHGPILGDDLKGSALVDLVTSALAAARLSSRSGAAIYVCLTWQTYVEFLEAVTAAELEVAACIVWDKGSIGLGQQHYRARFELIFYVAGEHWYGKKDQGDVWLCSRGDTSGYVHPTQKPVALVRRALENSSLPGDLVLDVFGGSGSTLIACEQTKRRGRLVELDPKYCDVIVKRWQNLTDGLARRLSDGAYFKDLVTDDE